MKSDKTKRMEEIMKEIEMLKEEYNDLRTPEIVEIVYWKGRKAVEIYDSLLGILDTDVGKVIDKVKRHCELLAICETVEEYKSRASVIGNSESVGFNYLKEGEE